MTANWLRLMRGRTAKFSFRLPSELPGISFTCRGRVRFRQASQALDSRLSAATARSATLAAVYAQASKASADFPPSSAFAVQQQLAAIFADWQVVPGRPINFRATVAVDLLAEDAALAASFEEARRAARLEEALTMDRMKFLRRTALGDEAAAGLWWLHRNIEGRAPDTSWDTFDERVRPLIASSDSQDDVATRITRAVTTLTGRFRDNPDQLEAFLNIASILLQMADHQDLAKELTPVAGTGEMQNHEGPSADHGPAANG